MKDNWQHRSAGMRCKTCMFFVRKFSGKEIEEAISNPKCNTQAVEDKPQGELGRCRRHAPTMNGFPGVFENDWCGDHKLDENKV